MLGIIAGILVARHLKTTQDLFDNRLSPRTESMVAAAVQWPVVLSTFFLAFSFFFFVFFLGFGNSSKQGVGLHAFSGN